MPVFRRIMEIIKEHPKVTDIFIMFVSDGQDTFSGMLPTDPSCQSILEQFKSMSGVETTFLTVGLSAHHDAAQMNRIANSGSQEGNFIYIDTHRGNY